MKTNHVVNIPPLGRSEQLIDVVYELLDAHGDTQRLLQAFDPADLSIRAYAHLVYLRDLQRVGREILADATQVANRLQPSMTHRP